jgi:hypothetical protein
MRLYRARSNRQAQVASSRFLLLLAFIADIREPRESPYEFSATTGQD